VSSAFHQTWRQLTDIDAIRKSYREGVAAQGGGIVSIDVVVGAGLRMVETVFKFPQQPHGMTYVGALTLAFRDFSYVVRVNCQEIGTTGIRDAVVFGKVLDDQGPVTIIGGDNPRLVGWSQDPYDPHFSRGALRNRADDDAWDTQFPDHPLSRVRGTLRTVKDSVHVPDDIRTAAPFEGPVKSSWLGRLTGEWFRGG
jgi:hypothetical protein